MMRSYGKRGGKSSQHREEDGSGLRTKDAHGLVVEFGSDRGLNARISSKVDGSSSLTMDGDKRKRSEPGRGHRKEKWSTDSRMMIFEFLTRALASETSERSPTDKLEPSSSI